MLSLFPINIHRRVVRIFQNYFVARKSECIYTVDSRKFGRVINKTFFVSGRRCHKYEAIAAELGGHNFFGHKTHCILEIVISPYVSLISSNFKQIWCADGYFDSAKGHVNKKCKLRKFSLSDRCHNLGYNSAINCGEM